MQSRYWGAWTNAYLNSGDLRDAGSVDRSEAVPAAFDLPKGVTVPAGRYDFNVYHGRIESALSRPVVGGAGRAVLRLLRRHLLQTDAEITLKPNETFLITAEHIMDRIDLPTGKVDIHNRLARPRRELHARHAAAHAGAIRQYLRGLWAIGALPQGIRAGERAADRGATIGQGAYVSHESAISVRLGHTVRF